MPSRRASSSEATTECGASAPSPSSGSRPMNRGVWNRLLGRATRHGAVDSDSAPPATTTLASPSATARMPSRMASRPEAHWRSTVSAGTLVAAGPAARPTMRAGLPPAVVLPRMISSTALGLEAAHPRAPPAPRAPSGSRCAGTCAARPAGRAPCGALQRCTRLPKPWPGSWGTHPLNAMRSRAAPPAAREAPAR